MGEREQLVWGPTGEVLTWDSSYSAEVGDVYVARRVVRWEAGYALNGNHCSEMGNTPQEALDALYARLTAQARELMAVCGIRSAEDERAAVVAIVRELEDSLRTTAHEHCGRGSASQEAFEVAAEAAAVTVQAIERGEHVGGCPARMAARPESVMGNK